MRKPVGSIAIMFGMPSPLAHDDHRERDEDNLNRERESGDGGGDDVAEFIDNIIGVLRDRGPAGVRAVRLVARGLEDLAQAVMQRDDEAFEAAAHDVHDALSELTE
jgi:hypothetical protein